MIPKLLYICFNNNSPVLQCSISYITQHGTVFHSFENSSFKDHSLGELILENKVINSFSIAFYKHHNLYTLQDERNFVKIIDENFANSYINSNEFTYTITESEEVIIYIFLDSICYGFNEGELYIKNVVKYMSKKDKLKEKLETDNDFLLSIILINKYLIIENCTFFKSITYNNRLIEKSLKILDDKNKVEFVFKNNTLNNKFIFLLDKNYVISLILDLYKIKKNNIR